MKNIKLNELHYMILNYLSAILLIPVTLYMKDIETTWLFVLTDVFLAVIFVISFYAAYQKNKAWSFVHSSLDKLDERELKEVGRVSRLAYAIFTIFALIIMLVLSVTELSINIVFTVALIYFAHILPASIHVFKNRKINEVDDET